MKPLIQGGLDGLCGVYSILNALKIVQGTTFEESSELFLEILRAMETRKRLSLLIEDGMSDRDMGYVYREVIQRHFPITILKPFHRRSEVGLGAYWSQVQDFLSDGRGRAVNLVAEGHDWGHWTVVWKATPKCLYLLDSDMMRRFDRRKCSTQMLSSNRELLLWPTMTRFLSRRE
jgi:hypothetical protein